jgi:hypothetical protein
LRKNNILEEENKQNFNGHIIEMILDEMILDEIDIKTNRVEAIQQYQMMASFI